VSNILSRAIVILLSVFVMNSTAHAVETTAQEFLDKYEHGDRDGYTEAILRAHGLSTESWARDRTQPARGRWQACDRNYAHADH
jgi:hypothetical protein